MKDRWFWILWCALIIYVLAGCSSACPTRPQVPPCQCENDDDCERGVRFGEMPCDQISPSVKR